ncbi:TetR/AcrR family transcriptional regulator [bacterium]|nr:TetR/AcrR family transcriptional regulator [bacterium]
MTNRKNNAPKDAVRDKRMAIIDAALTVIHDKGIMNATVDDIAHSAGVAKGTVYLYFKTKEDILVEMVVEKSGETLAAVREAASGVSGTWEKLRAAMRIHFAKIIEHMPNVLIDEGMLHLTAAQQKILLSAKFSHVKFYEEIIAEHCTKTGREPPFSPLASALALTSGLIGYVFQRHHFKDAAVDPEEYLRTYEAIVRAALIGGEIEGEKTKKK